MCNNIFLSTDMFPTDDESRLLSIYNVYSRFVHVCRSWCINKALYSYHGIAIAWFFFFFFFFASCAVNVVVQRVKPHTRKKRLLRERSHITLLDIHSHQTWNQTFVSRSIEIDDPTLRRAKPFSFQRIWFSFDNNVSITIRPYLSLF